MPIPGAGILTTEIKEYINLSFETESFETDANEPETAGKRSAFAVLESLSDRPLEQARKLEQYLHSCKERANKLTKKCSAKALAYVNESSPGLIA